MGEFGSFSLIFIDFHCTRVCHYPFGNLSFELVFRNKKKVSVIYENENIERSALLPFLNQTENKPIFLSVPRKKDHKFYNWYLLIQKKKLHFFGQNVVIRNWKMSDSNFPSCIGFTKIFNSVSVQSSFIFSSTGFLKRNNFHSSESST